ncbi:MAG TPA: hypothetical protein V6C78_19725 [Crinalium sp.]
MRAFNRASCVGQRLYEYFSVNRLLLHYRADVDAISKGGRTAIAWAVRECPAAEETTVVELSYKCCNFYLHQEHS